MPRTERSNTNVRRRCCRQPLGARVAAPTATSAADDDDVVAAVLGACGSPANSPDRRLSAHVRAPGDPASNYTSAHIHSRSARSSDGEKTRQQVLSSARCRVERPRATPGQFLEAIWLRTGALRRLPHTPALTTSPSAIRLKQHPQNSPQDVVAVAAVGEDGNLVRPSQMPSSPCPSLDPRLLSL